MKIEDIDHFFAGLSQKINFSVKIYMLGGAASLLQGARRVTYDIDFEVRLSKNTPQNREAFQEAVHSTGLSCGITPQYAEDVSRWSAIAMPEHRKGARLYKRYGKISVYIFDPIKWAIGKLARYLDSDISDLVIVLKYQKVPAGEAFRAWGRALGESPSSSAQPLFKKQVINFLHEKGKLIWGREFDA